MKKIIYYILIILGMNFFLLFLPILFFIFILSLPHCPFDDTFFFLYPVLAFGSPVLTIILCLRLTREYPFRYRWSGPLWIGLIGYSPIWLAFIFLTVRWNLLDYFGLIFLPFIPGLLTGIIIRVYQLCRKLLNRC